MRLSGVEKLTRSNLKGVSKGDFFWETDLATFEAIFSFKSPMPERRKAPCKTPISTFKKAPFLKPFLRLLNWTWSVFLLLRMSLGPHKEVVKMLFSDFFQISIDLMEEVMLYVYSIYPPSSNMLHLVWWHMPSSMDKAFDFLHVSASFLGKSRNQSNQLFFSFAIYFRQSFMANIGGDSTTQGIWPACIRRLKLGVGTRPQSDNLGHEQFLMRECDARD